MPAEMTPLPELLAEASINLFASASSRNDAIRQAGAGLLAIGAIDESYIDAMILRENSVSTFIGEGVAIPHGTLTAKGSVTTDALSLLRFPDGVDWDGNHVQLVFGLAARGSGHIALLSQLATVLIDSDRAAALRAATTSQEVYALLGSDGENDPAPT